MADRLIPEKVVLLFIYEIEEILILAFYSTKIEEQLRLSEYKRTIWYIIIYPCQDITKKVMHRYEKDLTHDCEASLKLISKRRYYIFFPPSLTGR